MKTIEDLEKEIKSIEKYSDICLILLVITIFVMAIGAITTYFKIKELAFAIQLLSI